MIAPLSYTDFVQQTIAANSGLAPDTVGLPWYNEAANLLLSTSNSYAYVVDYRTGGYAFFSNSFSEVVNYPDQLLRTGGIRCYTSLIHPHDWEIIDNALFKAMYGFMGSALVKPDTKYRFVFNYRLQQPDGKLLNIRQISHYNKLDQQGKPLICSGICTLIPYPVPTHKITYLLQSLNNNNLWENEDVKTFMPGESVVSTLSPSELKILHWIRNGYSSEKIAEHLNRSLHTIKTHRKNMLEKTHTRNTAELLQFSLTNGLC